MEIIKVEKVTKILQTMKYDSRTMSYVTVIINEFNSTITKYKLYVEKQNQIICCLQETQSKRHRKVDNNSVDMNQDRAGVAILFPK